MVAPTGAGTSTPHRYLRLLLEAELASGEGDAAAFAGALAALTGAGALAPALAAVLAADASVALALRGRPPLTAPGATGRPAGGGEPTMATGTAHGEAPAHRYLWQLITARLARLLVDGAVDRRGDAGPAVDALVACGAIGVDDPVAVQANLTDAVALGLGDEVGLDPRIRSVLDARDHLGANGEWTVDGPTVAVDGHQVRLGTVRADGVQLLVTGADRDDVGPWTSPIDLTATDDRGGWYVGLATGTSGGDTSWVLVPSLDPEAAQLTLTVAGPTQAATWRVALT